MAVVGLDGMGDTRHATLNSLRSPSRWDQSCSSKLDMIIIQGECLHVSVWCVYLCVGRGGALLVQTLR